MARRVWRITAGVSENFTGTALRSVRLAIGTPEGGGGITTRGLTKKILKTESLSMRNKNSLKYGKCGGLIFYFQL